MGRRLGSERFPFLLFFFILLIFLKLFTHDIVFFLTLFFLRIVLDGFIGILTLFSPHILYIIFPPLSRCIHTPLYSSTPSLSLKTKDPLSSPSSFFSNYFYFLLYIHLFFTFPSPFFSPSVFSLPLPLYAFIFLCVFLCNTPTTLTITCSLPSFLWTSFHLLPLFLLKITLR